MFKRVSEEEQIREASRRAAEALFRRFREAGHPAELLGNRVTVGPWSIIIVARIENQDQRDRKHLAGVGFAIGLQEKHIPTLYAGTVGIGASREEAVEVAAEEWSQLVGVALVRALVATKSLAGAGEAKPRLYSGGVGVRGSAGDASFEAVSRALYPALTPFAEALVQEDLTGIHSVAVMVNVDGRRAVDGECRLDGRVSPALLDAVRSLPWPPGQPGYLFKEFFVVRGG